MNKTKLRDVNLIPKVGEEFPNVVPLSDTLLALEKKPYNSIKLQRGGRFTEQDALMNKVLVPEGAWSHLYGDELDSRLELLHRSKLIDSDQIKRNLQGNNNTAWYGDGNPDYAGVKLSMFASFKLYVPCCAVFALDEGMYLLIDRRTTDAIVVGELEYENLICDIYKAKIDLETGLPYTFKELEDAGVFDEFGMGANIKRDLPAGKVGYKDIKNYLNNQVEKGVFEFDSFGKPDYDEVLAKIIKVSGTLGFRPATKEKLAGEICSQHDKSNTVKAWLNNKAVETWLTTSPNNFVDIAPVYYQNGKLKSKGVKYEVIGASQKQAIVKRTSSLSVANKDTEIRIILHTEVLDAYDQEENYWQKVNDFREAFDTLKTNVSLTFFEGAIPSDDKVKLYGVVPAVATIHSDFKKLAYFKGEQGYEDGDLDATGEEIQYGESMNWKQK